MATTSLPALAVSSQQQSIFGSYICTEPAGDTALSRKGSDPYTAALRVLQRSAEHFSEADFTRTVEYVRFEQSRLHMAHEQFEQALRILLPLWQSLSWRNSGWWRLLEQVDWALQECAQNVGDTETLIALQWELLNARLTPRHGRCGNLGDAIVGLHPKPRAIKVSLRSDNLLSCVTALFEFEKDSGHVGIPLTGKIGLRSHAHVGSAPVVFSRVDVIFDDCLRNISVEHNESSTSHETRRRTKMFDVELTRSVGNGRHPLQSPVSPNDHEGTFFTGSTNLSISPCESKDLRISVTPREMGDAAVREVRALVEEQDFSIEITFAQTAGIQDVSKPSSTSTETQPNFLDRKSIRILPKPPKLRIDAIDLDSEVYIGEKSQIEIRINNDEEDEASVTLDVSVLGPAEDAPLAAWSVPGDEKALLDEAKTALESAVQKDLGVLCPAVSSTHFLQVQAGSSSADHVLQIEARYSLQSDPETPIAKIFTHELKTRHPFEATFGYSPLLHPRLWPNYFRVSDSVGSTKGQGLVQKWGLSARLTNLTTNTVILESVAPEITSLQLAELDVAWSGSKCPCELASGDIQEHEFDLDVSKTNIEDRRPVYADLRLKVVWRRATGQDTITTYLAIPELMVPFGEPRVLAVAKTLASGVVQLEYTLENPSMYSLAFDISMETSEEFAFSGPKTKALQLVPLSRHSIQYRLMPLVKGTWISPQLRVYDTQFRKMLRVHAAGGLRDDKKGLGIWVDADG